jgi:hypothetical protein
MLARSMTMLSTLVRLGRHLDIVDRQQRARGRALADVGRDAARDDLQVRADAGLLPSNRPPVHHSLTNVS